MDRICLTEGRFHYGDAPDAWQAWFDDSAWEEVALPHDWSVGLPFSREYSSGTGYLAGGIGWYRIRIAPKEEWKGKRISLCFDGIYKNSRVWCNSYYLGQRPNGYISFSYDITHCFRYDRENVITVCADHRDISDSRWFTGSGMLCKAWAVAQEEVHPAYHSLFFTTEKVSEKEAQANVSGQLQNDSGQDADVTVTTTLLDSAGHPSAFGTQKLRIEAGQSAGFETSFPVSSPALWSPETPALYTLETSLDYRLADGTRVSGTADVQKVGIRGFRFDPDEGFFLNGVSMKIKGVCVHHDAGCLGGAVYPAVWRRRLLKLKEMGCNAIRMSHNPHMPELYDLCDELGFLVMDEAFDEWEGPKNKWWQGHNVYPPRNQGYYVDFPEWHERDLTDLICRDRNHPSIILWSIGNEIDYPNDPYCHSSFTAMIGNNDANKPAQELQYNPERPNAERLSVLAAHLSSIVKKCDPTRPVTLAAAFPELSAKLGFLDSVDVAGYNYKEHLYAQGHAAFPDKPFLGSENGHSLEAWRAVTDTPYISGQFLWTGIDYLGEAHGWPIHGSGAGLLTLAGFEKTGYYRRQSFWSEKPVLHLATVLASEDCGEFAPASERWNYPEGEAVTVKCYTNLPAVAFFLNGRAFGTYEKKADADCISLTVPFEPGTLTAMEAGKDVQTPLSDSLHTTGCACQMGLRVISDDADSLYQIEVTMQDYTGRRVVSDSTLLSVSVENGRLCGLENGDLADVTEYTAPCRRAYRGQLLIYVMPDAKNAPVIHISGEGIKSAQITL